MAGWCRTRPEGWRLSASSRRAEGFRPQERVIEGAGRPHPSLRPANPIRSRSAGIKNNCGAFRQQGSVSVLAPADARAEPEKAPIAYLCRT
jgi:hypothetical protein